MRCVLDFSIPMVSSVAASELVGAASSFDSLMFAASSVATASRAAKVVVDVLRAPHVAGKVVDNLGVNAIAAGTDAASIKIAATAWGETTDLILTRTPD